MGICFTFDLILFISGLDWEREWNGMEWRCVVGCGAWMGWVGLVRVTLTNGQTLSPSHSRSHSPLLVGVCFILLFFCFPVLAGKEENGIEWRCVVGCDEQMGWLGIVYLSPSRNHSPYLVDVCFAFSPPFGIGWEGDVMAVCS